MNPEDIEIGKRYEAVRVKGHTPMIGVAAKKDAKMVLIEHEGYSAWFRIERVMREIQCPSNST